MRSDGAVLFPIQDSDWHLLVVQHIDGCLGDSLEIDRLPTLTPYRFVTLTPTAAVQLSPFHRSDDSTENLGIIFEIR